MSEKTKISWANSTASPWYGCTKVSPGCKNCYAESWAKRGGKDVWGKGKPRLKSKSFEKDCRKWQAQAAKANEGLLAMDQERPRIFPSLCDWLDDEVPIEWLAWFMQIMHDCQNLDFLLLTKRPELYFDRTRAALRSVGWPAHEADEAMYCPNNVWIGVSVENQLFSDVRLPLLAKIPARIRFVSFEPLLEAIDPKIAVLRQATTEVEPRFGIDWAIIGGESGENRRDCGVEAICDLSEYLSESCCIPTWVKQDCSRFSEAQGRIPDEIWNLKQLPNLKTDLLQMWGHRQTHR